MLNNGQQHSIEKSRQLQRNLYLAAKKDKQRRFHALYDRIFRLDILWRAWKEVRENKGSAGIDGITFEMIEEYGVEEYLLDIQEDLKNKKYRPKPVKRVYIPKPDGKQRPLGIPTIRDRIVQQACKIVIEPIFEANFLDSSYGFRPKRDAKQATEKVKKELYKNWYVVDADIQGYFDNINHEILLGLLNRRISDRRVIKLCRQWLQAGVIENGKYYPTEKGSPQGGVISPLLANIYLHVLDSYWENHMLLKILRRNIKDERVVQIIKRYLKSGVMENGVVRATEEGSPQGGNLSPLLANIYLNEFDKEFERRGVPLVRYADDIVLLSKSKRASERILESSTRYLEKNLKLKVNKDKSRTVSVFALRNFKFLGFALGRNGNGIFIRVHGKSWKKMKDKLKELSSRRRVQSVKPVLKKIETYMRGWLNYYAVASMRNNIDNLNKWLYHRIRMCIWKMWRRPRSKMKYLMKLGVPMELAYMAANSRRGYWQTSNTIAVKMALTKERLIDKGYYDLSNAYQSMHINY